MPAWSPDGSKLLLMFAGSGSIGLEWWLLDWTPPKSETAGRVRRIFQAAPQGSFNTDGDWLSDGRHLVVALAEEGELGGPLWLADTVTGR